MSVLERCPSYRESNKGSKERQGPTLGVRLIEVSVKRESTVVRYTEGLERLRRRQEKKLNKGYLSMDFCRTRVSRVFHDKEPKQGRNSCPWLRLPGVRKPWGFFILSVFLLYGVS